jgi:heme/copper-type cytochrome/quinol oxidase subunit 2
MFGKIKKHDGQKIDWVNRISKALFAAIIVYAVVSVYTLLWGAIGVAPALPGTDIDSMWIYYSILSFVIVISIAVFHLSVIFLVEKEAK